MNMSFGNLIGFAGKLPDAPVGSIVAELTEDIDLECAEKLGMTSADPVIKTIQRRLKSCLISMNRCLKGSMPHV